MVPAWAAVTIALGASAIGALAGFFGAYISLRIAQLNLQHQESEAWRTRQLAAAEDFSALWVETVSGVGAVRGAITSCGDPGAALNQLAGKHSQAGAKLMRIGLLFGADSHARDFAREALSGTNHASAALEEVTGRKPVEVTDAERGAAVRSATSTSLAHRPLTASSFASRTVS